MATARRANAANGHVVDARRVVHAAEIFPVTTSHASPHSHPGAPPPTTSSWSARRPSALGLAVQPPPAPPRMIAKTTSAHALPSLPGHRGDPSGAAIGGAPVKRGFLGVGRSRAKTAPSSSASPTSPNPTDLAAAQLRMVRMDASPTSPESLLRSMPTNRSELQDVHPSPSPSLGTRRRNPAESPASNRGQPVSAARSPGSGWKSEDASSPPAALMADDTTVLQSPPTDSPPHPEKMDLLVQYLYTSNQQPLVAYLDAQPDPCHALVCVLQNITFMAGDYSREETLLETLARWSLSAKHGTKSMEQDSMHVIRSSPLWNHQFIPVEFLQVWLKVAREQEQDPNHNHQEPPFRNASEAEVDRLVTLLRWARNQKRSEAVAAYSPREREQLSLHSVTNTSRSFGTSSSRSAGAANERLQWVLSQIHFDRIQEPDLLRALQQDQSPTLARTSPQGSSPNAVAKSAKILGNNHRTGTSAGSAEEQEQVQTVTAVLHYAYQAFQQRQSSLPVSALPGKRNHSLPSLQSLVSRNQGGSVAPSSPAKKQKKPERFWRRLLRGKL